MELNELKPDFEKVAFAKGIENYHPNYFLRDWEEIVNGEIPYVIKDNENLKSFIKECNLEAHYCNLIYLIHENGVLDEIFKKQKGKLYSEELNKDYNLQYLKALKFLLDYEIDSIKVVFKHKKINLSISVNNVLLLKYLKEAWINEFYRVKGELFNEKGKDYWMHNLNSEIFKVEQIKGMKGRKNKYFMIGRLILHLQRYLQKYTDLKADAGVTISRKQASFIYQLCNIAGCIVDDLSWEQDNIRLILTKYIKTHLE